MDISSLVPTERLYEVKHPKTDEPIGIIVSLVSIDDDKLKAVKRRIADKRAHLEARGKSLSGSDIDNNTNEIVFAAMTGWQWSDTAEWRGKKNPPFNKETVFDVLNTLAWFRNQLSEEIGATDRFF